RLRRDGAHIKRDVRPSEEECPPSDARESKAPSHTPDTLPLRYRDRSSGPAFGKQDRAVRSDRALRASTRLLPPEYGALSRSRAPYRKVCLFSARCAILKDSQW